MRVDGAAESALTFDNMQDRPLRQTTGWVHAEIVLDVPPEADSVHFGALLNGAGALGLARPRFEEADPADPVPPRRLPEEPQALDFGIAPQARPRDQARRKSFIRNEPAYRSRASDPVPRLRRDIRHLPAGEQPGLG